MLSQGFFEDEETFFTPFRASMISVPFDSNQTLLLSQHSKQEEDLTSQFGASHSFTSQSSNANYWAWGEVSGKINNKILGMTRDHDHHLEVSGMNKMKKFKSRRKVREPRFCFKTMSDVDILDDGYKWRKYGQKVVKNTQHPRSYYRCTQDTCHVKKRVERLVDDPRMVITTYEGRHAHSPSQNEDDSEANSSNVPNFFWL
uniref:WRKY2 n=1 Tax=Chrysanthemum morifolium TaxID=41568 RepID=A0A088BK70_CHRMO|nr:WRKY2 [Chrysanthemum x morifolium]